MKRIILCMLAACFIIVPSAAVDQVREGNLSLATSQQPSPLFLYGQNIVDKGDFQFEFYVDWHKGKNQTFVDVLPGILCGVSDRFSLFINFPVTPKYQVNAHHSSGLEDIFVQGEYAVWMDEKKRSTDMVTLVGALYFPTGSATRNPHTGAGAPSFFLGFTASHMSPEWYAIVAPCVFLTTSYGGTKFGNVFLYQGCVGRNIFGNHNGWVMTAIIELFGLYQVPDRLNGVRDDNSGSNITYIGPTLWAASKKFFGQIGLLYPAFQSYKGCQNKNQFLFAVDIGWKFNV